MMRKENINPNRYALNKSINHKQQHPSTTPDSNTSRLNYKPKFIKKFAKVNEDHSRNQLSVGTPQESIQHGGDTFMHSPTSITENNTIDIENYRMKNKWKDLYLSTKQEM